MIFGEDVTLKFYEFDKGFAVGADISWVPQMLKSGFVFYDQYGNERDILSILKDYNMDTIRLRTWVNPTDNPHSGHCSAKETLEFATQCRAMGYRLMLNFHYSDSWADPKQQRTPAAWNSLCFDALVNKLYEYTHETMMLFKDNNIELEWVQIGNETNPGMMLPMGSKDKWENLTRLYSAGHEAVKAVMPDTKTMIHLAELNNTDFCIDYFENVDKNGCQYDMMGFSVYPYWVEREHQISYKSCMDSFSQSMRIIPERFGKDIMLVETGGIDEQENECYQLFIEILEEMTQQPKCKGILLWEPQGARVWSNYPLSAWRSDGHPSDALKAFNHIKRK